ncbi:hypothetical protein BC940DRAFT_368337 [Gongronella butleri]|nr:hypothetical protein BC940DRAFT_368337 [Gongronella butleri]
MSIIAPDVSVRVALDHAGPYFSGDMLKGRVIVTSPKAFHPHNLRLLFAGGSTIQPSPTDEHENHLYFRTDYALDRDKLQAKKSGNVCTYKASAFVINYKTTEPLQIQLEAAPMSYAFCFEIQIPDKDLPSCTSNEPGMFGGRISYTLECFMDLIKDDPEPIRAFTDVNVLEYKDAYAPEFKKACLAESVYFMWMDGTPKTQPNDFKTAIRATTNSCAVPRGGKLEITIHIWHSTNFQRMNGVSVTLVRERWMNYRGSLYAQTDTTVMTMRAHVDLRQENKFVQTLTCAMHVPETVTPSIGRNANLLLVKYKVVIKAQLQDGIYQIPHSNNVERFMSLEIPLTVCTSPVIIDGRKVRDSKKIASPEPKKVSKFGLFKRKNKDTSPPASTTTGGDENMGDAGSATLNNNSGISFPGGGSITGLDRVSSQNQVQSPVGVQPQALQPVNTNQQHQQPMHVQNQMYMQQQQLQQQQQQQLQQQQQPGTWNPNMREKGRTWNEHDNGPVTTGNVQHLKPDDVIGVDEPAMTVASPTPLGHHQQLVEAHRASVSVSERSFGQAPQSPVSLPTTVTAAEPAAEQPASKGPTVVAIDTTEAVTYHNMFDDSSDEEDDDDQDAGGNDNGGNISSDDDAAPLRPSEAAKRGTFTSPSAQNKSMAPSTPASTPPANQQPHGDLRDENDPKPRSPSLPPNPLAVQLQPTQPLTPTSAAAAASGIPRTSSVPPLIKPTENEEHQRSNHMSVPSQSVRHHQTWQRQQQMQQNGPPSLPIHQPTDDLNAIMQRLNMSPSYTTPNSDPPGLPSHASSFATAQHNANASDDSDDDDSDDEDGEPLMMLNRLRLEQRQHQ